MKVVFCCVQQLAVGHFKRALGILETQNVNGVEYYPTRDWYFTNEPRKMNQIANPKTVVFIGPIIFTRPLPDNAYHVTSAEMLKDLITLTEEECRRLDRSVFASAPTPIQDFLSRALGVIQQGEGGEDVVDRLFQQAQQASPPKRKLPVEWAERLCPDTVEPATAVTADEDACIICAEGNKRTVLFIPCDHLVSCEACAKCMMETKANCPICREPITDVRRIKK